MKFYTFAKKYDKSKIRKAKKTSEYVEKQNYDMEIIKKLSKELKE